MILDGIIYSSRNSSFRKQKQQKQRNNIIHQTEMDDKLY